MVFQTVRTQLQLHQQQTLESEGNSSIIKVVKMTHESVLIKNKLKLRLTLIWNADWESKSLPCRVSLYCW